jgi:hypothetical protein
VGCGVSVGTSVAVGGGVGVSCAKAEILTEIANMKKAKKALRRDIGINPVPHLVDTY